MKRWYCWVPWLALVLVSGAMGWQWWVHRQDRVRDQELQLQVDQAIFRAKAAEKAADEARKRSAEATADATIARARNLELEASLGQARARIRSFRTAPQDLDQAIEQLEACKGHGDACEARLSNEKEINLSLGRALEECQIADRSCQARADALEEAWKVTQKRAEAFARHTKRERRRKIVGYVGVGVAGLLAGVGIEAVRK